MLRNLCLLKGDSGDLVLGVSVSLGRGAVGQLFLEEGKGRLQSLPLAAATAAA